MGKACSSPWMEKIQCKFWASLGTCCLVTVWTEEQWDLFWSLMVLKLLTPAADKNGQEILGFFLGLLLFPWWWGVGCGCNPAGATAAASQFSLALQRAGKLETISCLTSLSWGTLMVVPWNRKHYFSATSPVRIRSLVWIFCKDFLEKLPISFFLLFSDKLCSLSQFRPA